MERIQLLLRLLAHLYHKLLALMVVLLDQQLIALQPEMQILSMYHLAHLSEMHIL
jgi:hypothetical protein